MKKNVLVSLLIALALSSSAFATTNTDGAAAGGTSTSYAVGDLTYVAGGTLANAQSAAISPDGSTLTAGSAEGGAIYAGAGVGFSEGGAAVEVFSLSAANDSEAGSIAGGEQVAGAFTFNGATAAQTLGSVTSVSLTDQSGAVSQAEGGSLSADIGPLAESLAASGELVTSYAIH